MAGTHMIEFSCQVAFLVVAIANVMINVVDRNDSAFVGWCLAFIMAFRCLVLYDWNPAINKNSIDIHGKQ